MTDSDAGQLPTAGRTDRLHLSPRHRETLEALLREHLPGIEVWAYGSRVNGESHDGSDLDLVLRAPDLQEVLIGPLADFTEALHDSTLPFLVEARDWARLPERFHKEIERGYVVVQKDAVFVKVENMSQWRRVMLDDVIDLRLSSVDKKSKANEHNVQLCNYMDVYKNSFIHARMDFMRATATEREIAKCSLVAGDVVITKDSEKYDDIGVPALVREDIPNLVCGYHLAILRPSLSKIDGAYLFYALSNDEAQQQFHSYANGITRFGLRKSDIGLVEISLPPLPEQRTIAHILSTLDDKIELNRRMNETLEALARALFKSWFVDFDPVRAKMEGRWRPGESLPGLPAHLYDLFPDRLVDSELGEIPEGWEVGRVDQLVTVVGGTTPSTKNIRYWEGGNHHWATPRDLASLSTPVLLNTERKITDAGLDKISSGLLPSGSILLSSRAPIGYLAIAEVPVAINQGFIGIRPHEGISNLFMLYWSKASKKEIVSYANGSTFLEINKRNFRRIPLVKPDEIVITMFDRGVRPFYERIVSNEYKSQIVATIRDMLLPKLVSREWRIGNLETLSNDDI